MIGQRLISVREFQRRNRSQLGTVAHAPPYAGSDPMESLGILRSDDFGSGSPPPTGYKEALQILLPSEIMAAFGILNQFQVWPGASLGIAICGLLVTAALVYHPYHIDRESDKITAWVHVTTACIALGLWLVTIGSPFLGLFNVNLDEPKWSGSMAAITAFFSVAFAPAVFKYLGKPSQ